MKKFALAIATAATLAAVPATAQSAFVMIVGEAPRPAVTEADTAPSRETLIESAVARACPAPFIRDLKRRTLQAACEAEARAEAEAVLAARDLSAATVVALR